MKPSNKGWIDEYVTFLSSPYKSHEFNIQLFEDFIDLDEQQKLYKLVQPSGLMYGHAFQPPGNYNINIANWDEAERMKFILLDCLINESILLANDKIETKNQFEEYIHQSIKSICAFYQENVIHTDKIKKGKKKSESLQLESIIENRIQVKSWLTKNFWAGFFQNSLLFLDVYYFSQWLQNNKVKSDKDLFNDQENLRLSILQTIASAAWANDNIEDEEKALFNFFLQSANLNNEKEKWAKNLLESNNRIEHVQIIEHEPWIIKKYILELAILTIWADRKVESAEKDFIEKLSHELEFSQDELETSLLAVESFVLSHWKEIHFLQSKHDMLIIRDRFAKRFLRIAKKNKNAFVQEIRESKELMQLMMKMSREKLTESEKLIVRAQLMDLLKTLPTFVIIALPGTFITLPLLLKLLPKKAFPSAFSEVD